MPTEPTRISTSAWVIRSLDTTAPTVDRDRCEAMGPSSSSRATRISPRRPVVGRLPPGTGEGLGVALASGDAGATGPHGPAPGAAGGGGGGGGGGAGRGAGARGGRGRGGRGGRGRGGRLGGRDRGRRRRRRQQPDPLGPALEVGVAALRHTGGEALGRD